MSSLNKIIGFVLLAAASAFAAEGAARVERDVAYGLNRAQKLDVYLPSHPKKAPIIMMVHGGAWVIGDKSNRRVVVNKVAHWVPQGYIFISVNNRLLPEADPLEQAYDVARALAFVQSKAESWGGDPAHIVLMGHSAGAHLVDLVTADSGIATQEGAKPWMGTVSLDTAMLNVPERMNARHPRLYDNAFGTDPKFWESVSPMQRLTKVPNPMLLVCSTRRPDRPCRQAEQFAARVKSLGGKATVLEQPLTHSEINETLGLPEKYTDAVDEFLKALVGKQ